MNTVTKIFAASSPAWTPFAWDAAEIGGRWGVVELGAISGETVLLWPLSKSQALRIASRHNQTLLRIQERLTKERKA